MGEECRQRGRIGFLTVGSMGEFAAWGAWHGEDQNRVCNFHDISGYGGYLYPQEWQETTVCFADKVARTNVMPMPDPGITYIWNIGCSPRGLLIHSDFQRWSPERKEDCLHFSTLAESYQLTSEMGLEDVSEIGDEHQTVEQGPHVYLPHLVLVTRPRSDVYLKKILI